MVDWNSWGKEALRKQNLIEAIAKERKNNLWPERLKNAGRNGYVSWTKEYRNYQNSKLWRLIRDLAKINSGGICGKCQNQLVDPDVHHKNYKRVGGEEEPEDLWVICGSCHVKIHNENLLERDERWTHERFLNRLDGFAKRESQYEELWWYFVDEDEMELKFIIFLYRNMLKKSGNYNSDEYEDPEGYTEFYEFWHDVLNGTDQQWLNDDGF